MNKESFSLFQNLLENQGKYYYFLSNIEITIADQMQEELSKDVTKKEKIEDVY